MITGAETAHLGLRPAALPFDGRLPVVSAQVAHELGMRDDQVVQALVQAQPEGLRLELKGRPVPLPRDLALAWQLQPGDVLQFRVRRQAGGGVQLLPVPTKPDAAAQTGTTTAALAAEAAPDLGRLTRLAYRPPGLENLGQLLQPGILSALAGGLDPPELLAAVQHWLSLRPQMSMLTAQALQHYLVASGWMTEAALAQGRGAGLVDLKTTLRLLLRNATPGTRDAEGLGEAIDEIEARQLAAAHSPGGREGMVVLMLPFADASPVTLKFGRPAAQPDQAPPPLRIDLHTASAELGELWLQTRIHTDNRVDLVMWARRQDIARAAQRQAAGLQQALESAGLHMTRLQIIHGARPAEPDAWQAPAPGSMVDRSC